MEGKVYTFYSYKGGVGRSMAMANVGALLAVWGKKVLLIDWDLEAPGLENYLKEGNEHSISEVGKKEGLIDLLLKRKNDATYDAKKIIWSGFISSIPIKSKDENVKCSIDILTAGRRDDGYIRKVRELDYGSFYEESMGGEYLEEMREYWVSHYDIILIDSRTGLTDSSGVCTIQMPDALVMLFTATEQGYAGTLNIAKRAIEAQKKIIYDRYALKILPVPTRFDSTEFKLQRDWLTKFERGLKDLYKTWVPDYPNDEKINIDHRKILDLTKLPYVPYFSYGEKLPVIEQGTADPQGLGYAIETISALLAHDLEGAKLLADNRTEYVRRAVKGISPYVEFTPTLDVPVPKSVSNKYLVPALVAAVGVVLLLMYLLKKQTSSAFLANDPEVKTLQYQLNVKTLQNNLATIDTDAIKNILDLNRNLHNITTLDDTSSNIVQIRQTIQRAVQRELEFFLPLIYPEIQSYHKNTVQKLKTAEEGTDTPRSPIDKYFADTIAPFGPYTMLTKEELQNKLILANLINYNNKIEEFSIGKVRPDSNGFQIDYQELANYYYIGKDTVYRRSSVPLLIPVTLYLNYDLKIKGLKYGDPKEILTQETASVGTKPNTSKIITNSKSSTKPNTTKPSQKSEIIIESKANTNPKGTNTSTTPTKKEPQIDSTVRKVEYVELKKEDVFNAKAVQTRVEIILNEKSKSSALINYQAKAIFEELAAQTAYLPRKSGNSEYLDKKETYSISSSVILYSKSNSIAAKELQSFLVNRLKMQLDLKLTYATAENYLMVYLMDVPISNTGKKGFENVEIIQSKKAPQQLGKKQSLNKK